MVVKIDPKTINFAKRAKQLGRQFKDIPLKDGSSAKVSWCDNACDCFVVRNNKVEEARGASGNREFVQNQLAKIMNRLKGVL